MTDEERTFVQQLADRFSSGVRYGEYRESVDVDLLVSDQYGLRTVIDVDGHPIRSRERLPLVRREYQRRAAQTIGS